MHTKVQTESNLNEPQNCNVIKILNNIVERKINYVLNKINKYKQEYKTKFDFIKSVSYYFIKSIKPIVNLKFQHNAIV